MRILDDLKEIQARKWGLRGQTEPGLSCWGEEAIPELFRGIKEPVRPGSARIDRAGCEDMTAHFSSGWPDSYSFQAQQG